MSWNREHHQQLLREYALKSNFRGKLVNILRNGTLVETRLNKFNEFGNVRKAVHTRADFVKKNM